MLFHFFIHYYMLLIAFSFIGIAWAAISTRPYNIISSIAPEDKMTAYFAIFNFSVVIPQVTAAFLLGYLNRHCFAGETVYVILTGGISMLVAAVIMFVIPEMKMQKGLE